MRRLPLLAGCALLGLSACVYGPPANPPEIIFTQTAPSVVLVPNPPPAPQPELVPPPPQYSGNVVWQPGHWRYAGTSGSSPWAWEPGRYTAPPAGQSRWIPGQWQQQPGGWSWAEGHWA